MKLYQSLHAFSINIDVTKCPQQFDVKYIKSHQIQLVTDIMASSQLTTQDIKTSRHQDIMKYYKSIALTPLAATSIFAGSAAFFVFLKTERRHSNVMMAQENQKTHISHRRYVLFGKELHSAYAKSLSPQSKHSVWNVSWQDKSDAETSRIEDETFNADPFKKLDW